MWHAYSGPPPPNATSVKSRGSNPRRTEFSSIACTIVCVWILSAARRFLEAHAERRARRISIAACARCLVEGQPPAEEASAGAGRG